MINLKDINKKQGAIDALTLLLASKQRPIRLKKDDAPGADSENGNELKMPKNVELTDVDEEEKELGEEETEEEKENRLAQAKADDEPEVLQRDLKSIKNELETVSKERESKKQEKEYQNHVKEINSNAKLVSSGKMRLDYKWFYRDLENAINDQIEQSNKWEDSYDAFNSTYADSGVLMPGEVRAERKQKPIISVYFDLSGSLPNGTIAKAKESLSFLNDLENSGDIESYTVYYFAGTVNEDPAKVGGGTTAYPEILDRVKRTGADNVIIFTDSDFDHQSGRLSDLPYVKIDGCMWWMWARGDMARKAWPHLTSSNSSATYHYDIR